MLRPKTQNIRVCPFSFVGKLAWEVSIISVHDDDFMLDISNNCKDPFATRNGCEPLFFAVYTYVAGKSALFATRAQYSATLTNLPSSIPCTISAANRVRMQSVVSYYSCFLWNYQLLHYHSEYVAFIHQL